MRRDPNLSGSKAPVARVCAPELKKKVTYRDVILRLRATLLQYMYVRRFLSS